MFTTEDMRGNCCVLCSVLDLSFNYETQFSFTVPLGSNEMFFFSAE